MRFFAQFLLHKTSPRIKKRSWGSFISSHPMDARGRSKRGGYRRENRNDEMQDFLPEFFVHGGREFFEF